MITEWEFWEVDGKDDILVSSMENTNDFQKIWYITDTDTVQIENEIETVISFIEPII